MKKILTFLFIVISSVSFAQQKGNVTLNWIPTAPVNVGDVKYLIPQFDIRQMNFDAYKKTLGFRLKIPQTSKADVASLQITDAVYEAISPSELGNLSVTNIPTALQPTITNLQSRDKLSVLLTLNPIIKDGSGFKKLTSFQYSFNSGTARPAGPASVNVITNSVLASGDFYKFYVSQSGAYYINRAFLQQLGINTDNVDPRKIKIYGNGGRMLPLRNDVPYPIDIEENAILVSGEDDGAFNDNDYIVFYAEGVDNWNAESQTSGNLYADRSYYYINVQGNNGKRIQPMLQPSAAGTPIAEFDDYQYYEKDLNNIGKLGRRWFGEAFDIEDTQTFDFNVVNPVAGSSSSIRVYTGAVAAAITSFKIDVNAAQAGTISMDATETNRVASGGELNYSFPATENVSVKLTYNNNGVPSSTGYLDFIALKSKRSLKGYGKQFIFQYDASATQAGIGEYTITNAAAIGQVWDITDIYNVTNAINNAQQNFSFKATFGALRKYIAVDFNNLYVPTPETNARVNNQNLKGNIFTNAGGQLQDVDYLIITPSGFSPQAERLANFHRNYSGLNVKVVTLESIYEEFGSGKQDVGAIRNFIKYVYNNAPNGNKVQYVNLFGDASYDFKNRITVASNFVPIYHALNGYTLLDSSFCSDDYFVSMDDNEGNMDSPPVNDEPDIAVGRMIASSNIQADQLVTKVIDYHDIKSYGSWRNNYVCIADDPSLNAGGTFTSDNQLQDRQNKLADKITLEKPFINVSKIFLDSYVQETSAGGDRYPKARQDVFNAFEKGALVFNYLGHGGEDGLAQERIYEKSDGQNLFNRYKYPLFITITCEFSRFDNPLRPTAGEFTFLNPQGGAIAMITTVRAIYQDSGQNFNDLLAKHLFSYGSDNYVSMAEAMRLAKEEFSNSSNIIFFLGDPAMKLAIPRPKVNLTKVNGMPLTGPIDDLKALSFVTLSGEVTDEAGNPLTSYTGDLAVQIFDKDLNRQTLRNDGANAVGGTFMPFKTLGETIFRGNASVTNGQFEFGFVVPRDITIPLGNGRISFYGKRGQILLDKTGYNTTIKVGGINENAPADNIGPTVKLYMNDTNFVNGGITNQSPIFLAFLEDENGINTASGIGHDIVAILDGDESNPYKLNDYYETELDNYKKGNLKYPFRNLALGLHTITFKAWDVYNNLVTAEIQFVVVGDESITITNVLNYPNPFVNYTQFWFTHNKPFEPLDVQVQILTITGKVVWTHNQTVVTEGFLSRDISWDGKDDFGDRIGKGVYIYKLSVRSMVTNTKTHKYEKLVIL